MATLFVSSPLCISSRKLTRTLQMSFNKTLVCNCKSTDLSNGIAFSFLKSPSQSSTVSSLVARSNLPTAAAGTRNYEFFDGAADVELRILLEGREIQSSRDVFVDVDERSLTVRVQSSGSLVTLLETDRLYERIKPSDTIWCIDEDQVVINLKKLDIDLKWPDIMETWESLTGGVLQLLKGASIYIIGDSTEINHKIAKELAVGLGYTPLSTSELLETIAKQNIDSWVIAEGADSVVEAEASILESLSSHIRTVVGTLGGQYGAAGRADRWQHLHSVFTVWLSQSEATNGASSAKEAQTQIEEGSRAYSNADVVVKLESWNPDRTKKIAESALSSLKQLILSDKKLPGKKGLYIRLGCRGDWPNIKPPGWDPESGVDPSV